MAVEEALEALKPKRKRQGPWAQGWARFRRKKLAMACLIIIVTFYVAAIFAPWVTPAGFNDQDFGKIREGPSLGNWFGTDWLGRDQFTRVIYGLRTTVIITLTSLVAGSLFIGILVGLVSGYVGGRVDNFIMRVGDILLAFPGLLLVILMAATVKPRVLDWVHALEDNTFISGLASSGFVDYLVVFTALSIIGWVGMARLIRGQILSLKNTEFVAAARVIGASHWRVISRHLFPNTLNQIIVVVSFGLGAAAGSEVFLSFLGIGIQPPNPSLGTMIFQNADVSILRTAPHLLLIPAGVVGTVLFSFNIIGDALSDALNPRTR